jgi:hypothetical protein
MNSIIIYNIKKMENMFLELQFQCDGLGCKFHHNQLKNLINEVPHNLEYLE